MRDILLDFSSPEGNEQIIELLAVTRTGGVQSGKNNKLMSCISRLKGNLNDDV